jgi:hypothetical protein
MGLMALLPLGRKACCEFLFPLKIHLHWPGLNVPTFVYILVLVVIIFFAAVLQQTIFIGAHPMI